MPNRFRAAADFRVEEDDLPDLVPVALAEELTLDELPPDEDPALLFSVAEAAVARISPAIQS
jgi:hypothetical protein